MSRGTRKLLTWGLVVAGVLAIGAISAAAFVHGRIVVTVHNTTAERLRGVCASVTGDQASIGDIEAGASGACAVVPSGDSNVVVSFVGASGAPRQHDVDVYVERGSSGTVDVWLADQGVVKQNYALWWHGP